MLAAFHFNFLPFLSILFFLDDIFQYVSLAERSVRPNNTTTNSHRHQVMPSGDGLPSESALSHACFLMNRNSRHFRN